jgi:uncharacterized damage-inducible protein DinB
MAIKDALLPEFTQEMAVTRTVLERVPTDRADWKPHAKSMSLGELAMHLAEVPSWLGVTFGGSEFDTNPPGGTPYRSKAFTSTSALVAAFDANVVAGREALSHATDEQFMQPWALKSGGHVLMSMPRAAVVRGFVLNHLIHHRGQLSVYLRLLDVPLPSIYGPTADLKQFG